MKQTVRTAGLFLKLPAHKADIYNKSNRGKRKKTLFPYIVGIWLTENSVSQIYRFRLFFHVYRGVNLCGNYAAMSQYLTH